MIYYLLRRLLLAIPTLLIISVLAFLLGQRVTRDPLQLRGGANYTGQSADPEVEAAFHTRQARLLHLDKPEFYFSITLDCFPDTLHRIFPYYRRARMRQMALAAGAWAPVQAYDAQLAAAIRAGEQLPDSLFPPAFLNLIAADLAKTADWQACHRILNTWRDSVRHTEAAAAVDSLQAALEALAPRPGWGRPVFYWHGWNNQYHDWLIGRYAHETGSPWARIRYSLRVTLLINGLAIVLSFLIGIPLGVWVSKRPGNWYDRLGRAGLMALHVAPVILIGCILRYGWATPGYGFYSAYIGGVGTGMYDPSQVSFWAWAWANQGKLLLPVVTLTLHFSTLIALQMRTGMLEVGRQDYIRTARAKGLSEGQVRRRHAFRNAVFPVITIFGALLPAAVGGSVVVEAIFNINGMGYTAMDAVLTGDFPVMMSVVVLSATLTIAGLLLADLLYAWLDPRVKEGFSGA